VARTITAIWLLLALLWQSGPAEQSVAPGVNAQYQHADPDQWRGVFERDGREIWDRRGDILAALQLSPGQSIADVGAGTGFFSLMFAGAVGPGGRVYAVDISPEFIDSIALRAREAGHSNITALLNTPRSAMLPVGSVDLVFTSDTYHHFEYPREMLASIHAALRDDGELVVIDFSRVEGQSSPWVLRHVRAGESVVQAEIEAAGFELVERLDFMQTQFFLRFRKR